MASSHLMIQDYAGIAVVTFADSSILDARVIEAMGKSLYELIDVQDRRKIILDFVNVKLLSSQTIGVLLTLRKKLAAAKGTLLLCGLRKEVMKLFTITNLDKQFDFFPDDVAALASLGVRVQ